MTRNKILLILMVLTCYSCGENRYLSPGNIAIDVAHNIAYTALTTNQSVAITDLNAGKTGEIVKLRDNPAGVLVSSDGSTLYASCGKSRGTVELIRLPAKTLVASIETGHSPQDMALSADEKTLYVANRFSNNISVIDLSSNKVITTIPTIREPRSICIAPDGRTLAAANFLPAQASTDSIVAAQITLIDLPANKVRANVLLENGAQSATGICSSPDGRYLYVCHLLSKYDIPVTQVDRGWVNTNALGIIDLTGDSLYATLLLDDIDLGAANPAGICADAKRLYIAVAGTHELIVIERKTMHDKLSAFFAGNGNEVYIQNSTDLSSSLSFTASFKKRIGLKGHSPRAVACCGKRVVVGSRFDAFLEVFEDFDKPQTLLALGKESAPDAVRRGELAFCDASICYQGWQSCVSCHPDARADGLNWDQQNDGLGNPKNTKSLLFSHVTPPCMITGIRENAETAVRNGILHTLQTVQPEQLARDIDEYLKNLEPEESPYLAEYRAKDPQEKGKALFERTGCMQCHGGKYFTDKRKYNAGTGDDNDKETPFDTPTLREIWRTAPYLYNGKAASLREMLTNFNADDKHGVTQNLTEEELQALILYVLTI